MIVYVSDPIPAVDNIEFGCLCSLAKCNCIGESGKTLVDIGLTYAQAQTIPLKRYMSLINAAVKHGETYAIVPDVFCNPEKTVTSYRRYAKAIRQRGAKTVLVLQRFYESLDVYRDVLHEADVVALPAHRHCDVSCVSKPRLCAERISHALAPLAKEMKLCVHLLGPTVRTLRALNPVLRDICSFDTTSYRWAPTQQVADELGGKRLAVSREMARRWLLQWLKKAGVI